LNRITLPLPPVTETCSPGNVTLTGAIITSNGVPLSPSIPLTNGSAPAATLPPGVHVVRWTATDGVNSSHADQTIRIESCWTEFGRDASRSRRSSLAGPTTNQRAFVFSGSLLDIKSSPAVASDGTVYVGTDDSRVYAVNVDGSQKWRSANTGAPVRTSPAIGFGGAIFVANDIAKLVKLDKDTGATLCQVTLQGLLTDSSPVIGSDGTVYIGSDDRFYAINPGTCAVKWSYRANADIHSSPAVGKNAAGTADLLYFGADDNKLYAVDATGALVWTFATSGDVHSSPAVSADGTTVYVGSDDDHVYAVDAHSGVRIWARDVRHAVDTAPAIGPTGTLFVSDRSGNVHALAPADGSIVWERNIGLSLGSSPAVDANNAVFVGSDDDRVYALNGATGAVIWSYKTAADVRSSPAIGSQGTVYVGSDDGKLYAFGVGQVLGDRWSADEGSASNVAASCGCRMAEARGVHVPAWLLVSGLGALPLCRRRRRVR
jgi:outer membrane protein assembly factor BamB